jgi:hypothetical protein
MCPRWNEPHPSSVWKLNASVITRKDGSREPWALIAVEFPVWDHWSMPSRKTSRRTLGVPLCKEVERDFRAAVRCAAAAEC